MVKVISTKKSLVKVMPCFCFADDCFARSRVGKNRLYLTINCNILYFLFIECTGAFTFLNKYRIWPCL